jgi:hypothetical protein
MRALVASLVLLLAASPARATFHLWHVNEVFSTADGEVQFIEFFTSSSLQNFLNTHQFQVRAGMSIVDTYTFDKDLPIENTQDRFFVVGTPDFEAAAGIEPDFVMDADFFDPLLLDGVVLVGGDPGTELLFQVGSVPIDGVSSFHRDAGAGPGSGPNTPTNFAGDEGSIDLPEPEASWLGLAAAAVLASLAPWSARRPQAGGAQRAGGGA